MSTPPSTFSRMLAMLKGEPDPIGVHAASACPRLADPDSDNVGIGGPMLMYASGDKGKRTTAVTDAEPARLPQHHPRDGAQYRGAQARGGLQRGALPAVGPYAARPARAGRARRRRSAREVHHRAGAVDVQQVDDPSTGGNADALDSEAVQGVPGRLPHPAAQDQARGGPRTDAQAQAREACTPRALRADVPSPEVPVSAGGRAAAVALLSAPRGPR
ncbi:hypothetical protein FA95DRAFT_966426 [Auriscalpium vulgare]|uniref:Uncharacterized protein n=1 Tax=Auriscalpium vulgare TaxID=40419 RepID=A0ACB8R6Z7_9AGAM|nr:hypothetical protein FA95DRAFT_966426 [Auriscalpium vulgare]